jgi:hypothetical protein
MERICRVSGRPFEIPDQDLAFLERLAPVVGGRRFALPPPALSPTERKRLRLAFRNERNLYRRVCDFSGKTIVSAYSPDKPIRVYSKDAWWSDQWDGRSFGRDFDFSRPFFEQFAELKREAPHLALITSRDADEYNCPYVNFSGNSRNCHMTFDSDFNEDSCYSNVLKHSKNCLDCSYVHSSELCYECIDCSRCYRLLFSQDCTNCSESAWLRSCIGCSNCLLCTNLVQKQYYIENRPCTKAEYQRRLKEFNLGSFSAQEELCRRFDRFQLEYPKRYCRMYMAENCSGDYILNARNCHDSFNIAECEDAYYGDALYGAKDCMDVSSFGEKIERVYNSSTIGINCFNIHMCEVVVENCSDMIYCDNCRQSRNCLGCCSLWRREYCVLNKQYRREEYEALSIRIIEHMQRSGEWGEFFPPALSPFGYNETMAGEYYPLSREEALALGANWSDYEPPAPDVMVMAAEDLPDGIEGAGDEILGAAVRCAASGKPFRLLKPELQFYRRVNAALPRRHPDERYRARMRRRNPQRLWRRACAKSGRPILTSYAPDRPEIVYCEEAFQEALI